MGDPGDGVLRRARSPQCPSRHFVTPAGLDDPAEAEVMDLACDDGPLRAVAATAWRPDGLTHEERAGLRVDVVRDDGLGPSVGLFEHHDRAVRELAPAPLVRREAAIAQG